MFVFVRIYYTSNPLKEPVDGIINTLYIDHYEERFVPEAGRNYCVITLRTSTGKPELLYAPCTVKEFQKAVQDEMNRYLKEGGQHS